MKKEKWAKEFEVREILEEYSKYLQDSGYLDDDWWCEEPKAIDRYIEEEWRVKNK